MKRRDGDEVAEEAARERAQATTGADKSERRGAAACIYRAFPTPSTRTTGHEEDACVVISRDLSWLSRPQFRQPNSGRFLFSVTGLDISNAM